MRRVEDPSPQERHLQDVVSLQAIRRNNGEAFAYRVTVPLFICDRLGWKGGDRIAVEETFNGKMVLTNISLQQHHVEVTQEEK